MFRRKAVINRPTESCGGNCHCVQSEAQFLFSPAIRCLPFHCYRPKCTSVSLAPACGVQTVYSTISLFCHFECLWNQPPKSRKTVNQSFWMLMFHSHHWGAHRTQPVSSAWRIALLFESTCLASIQVPQIQCNICLPWPLQQKFRLSFPGNAQAMGMKLCMQENQRKFGWETSKLPRLQSGKYQFNKEVVQEHSSVEA